MKNEPISERQGIILIILFILGSTLLVSPSTEAKQDAWIAVIIAFLWSIILLLMFSRLLSLYPGKDLFDILEIVMGKFIGKFISILMIWFAFHIGTLVMRNISDFTNTLVFPDTPVVLPLLPLALLLIWGLKAGIEVIGRWGEFFIWIVILLFIFYTSLSITEMDVNRLKPMLNNGIALLLKGAFSSFTFPFGEIVIFTMVFSNISKSKNLSKVFLLGSSIGGFIILLSTLRNLAILGSERISSVYFPSILTISLIHIGNMFQRLEILMILAFLVCIFIKIIICLFAVCNGISKIFGFDDYRFVATPVTLLMFSFSIFIYKSTMEMVAWTAISAPYTFSFEVIIPLIIFITSELKIRSSSSILPTK
jgi:spore germination protein KB